MSLRKMILNGVNLYLHSALSPYVDACYEWMGKSYGETGLFVVVCGSIMVVGLVAHYGLGLSILPSLLVGLVFPYFGKFISQRSRDHYKGKLLTWCEKYKMRRLAGIIDWDGSIKNNRLFVRIYKVNVEAVRSILDLGANPGALENDKLYMVRRTPVQYAYFLASYTTNNYKDDARRLGLEGISEDPANYFVEYNIRLAKIIKLLGEYSFGISHQNIMYLIYDYATRIKTKRFDVKNLRDMFPILMDAVVEKGLWSDKDIAQLTSDDCANETVRVLKDANDPYAAALWFKYIPLELFSDDSIEIGLSWDRVKPVLSERMAVEKRSPQCLDNVEQKAGESARVNAYA